MLSLDGAYSGLLLPQPRVRAHLPLTQHLARILKLMMPPVHQEGKRRFVTHILRLSGESRVDLQAGWKMG